MKMIEFADDEIVPIKELTELYESVDWIVHATDPDRLARAVDRSDYVITARNADGELVGLARCLTDEVHVLLIQEVIVRPDHQRSGIGTVMVARCLQTFDHVRQKVVLSDDPALEPFFVGLGFSDASVSGIRTFTLRS